MNKSVIITNVEGSNRVINNSTSFGKISDILLKAYIEQLALEEQEDQEANSLDGNILYISRNKSKSHNPEDDSIRNIAFNENIEINYFLNRFSTPECKLNNIIKVLKEKKIFKSSINQLNQPKDIFIRKGFFVVADIECKISNESRLIPEFHITPKGRSWLVGQLFELGLIDDKTLLDYFNPVLIDENGYTIVPPIL
jgi:hypothetical protein